MLPDRKVTDEDRGVKLLKRRDKNHKDKINN